MPDQCRREWQAFVCLCHESELNPSTGAVGIGAATSGLVPILMARAPTDSCRWPDLNALCSE
jgi:hypothetical protein